MQRILKDNGFDLGAFGQNRDGIDGDIGRLRSMTQKAAREFLGVDKIANPNEATATGTLGALSAIHESSGTLASNFGDATTVSTGKDDPGGPSFGKHQISTDAGTLDDFMNKSGEVEPFKKLFVDDDGKALTVPKKGSSKEVIEAFKKKFVEITKGPEGEKFAQAQKDYLIRTHYKPALIHATRAGLDTTDRGVQEAIFSMAIQHKGANTIVDNAVTDNTNLKNATPAEQIAALYGARGAYVKNYRDTAKGLTEANKSLLTNVITTRFPSELRDAQKISQHYQKYYRNEPLYPRDFKPINFNRFRIFRA